jgi:hypothetical protein
VTDPFDNDGKFLVHPDRVLMALIPDRQRAEFVLEALRAAGHPLDRVKVLHGEGGARVLDRRGEHHGLFARLHRWWQKFTYYQTVLGLFAAGLKAGEFLIYLPTEREYRQKVGQLLVSRQAHAVHYFGFGTVETLSGA